MHHFILKAPALNWRYAKQGCIKFHIFSYFGFTFKSEKDNPKREENIVHCAHEIEKKINSYKIICTWWYVGDLDPGVTGYNGGCPRSE